MSSDELQEQIKDYLLRYAAKDGMISKHELRKAFSWWSHRDVDDLFAGIDADKIGRIDCEEFAEWIIIGSSVQETQEEMQELEYPPQSPAFRAGKRISMDYKALLPARFQVDIQKRYTLDKTTLGEGGFGKVYVARDMRFENRDVVVKKVTMTCDRSPSAPFRREIEIMKGLDHPHICKLLETFEDQHSIYFVMEHLEGGELFDRIIKEKTISEKTVATIMWQVASAIRYAHDRKIVHRDIKPENVVFCTKNGQSVKLIDWGLGISFLNCVMTESVGSALYMAPEVMDSGNANAYCAACDLWSIGVLTYVTLSGRPPFWGSKRDHLSRAKAEEYPFTGACWDSVSPQAKDFVKKLLKANPADRLPIEQVLEHAWLTATEWQQPHADQMSMVLKNLRDFSSSSTVSAMCITAVARQLDHRKLTDVHHVFKTLDKNNDGVLSLEEIESGFGELYGKDSEESKKALEIFKGLDLDESATIDYTEFCAGGLGLHTVLQEEACWAAFKVFDVDNSDSITIEELKKVLESVDLKKLWSKEVCVDVAEQIIAKHDKNGDGEIDFNEFRAMMHASRASNDPLIPAGSGEDAMTTLVRSVSGGRFWREASG